MNDIFPHYSVVLVVLTYISFGVVVGLMVTHFLLADHLIQKNYTSRISKLVVNVMWSVFKLLAVWAILIALIMLKNKYPEEANPFNALIAIASMVGTVYFHGKFIRENPFQE